MESKEPFVKGVGFNVFKIETDERVTITGAFSINCGFPSPAADFEADEIDLNKLLIKNKNATFYGIAEGDSMKGSVFMMGQ
jgi:SOS-response transcriptional repressor LexA